MDRLVQSSKYLCRWLVGDGAPLGRRARAVVAVCAALLVGVGLVTAVSFQGSGVSTAAYGGSQRTGADPGRTVTQVTDQPSSDGSAASTRPGHRVGPHLRRVGLGLCRPRDRFV